MQTYEPSRKATSSHSPVPAYDFLAPRPFAEPPQPEALPLSTASGGVGISLARINCVPQELRPVLQPKLTIGEPGDQYEQEADRVAADVVQKMNAPAMSLTPPASGVGDEQPLQRQLPLYVKQRDAASNQVPVQRTEAEIQRSKEFHENVRRNMRITDTTLQAKFEARLESARSGGAPLDNAFRAKVEPLMGADFSGVRVHTDAQADQLSRSIQAQAFTTKQDVFFRQGAYEPGSRGGQELIAHELTHVVQQGAKERKSGATQQQKEAPSKSLFDRPRVGSKSRIQRTYNPNELTQEEKACYDTVKFIKWLCKNVKLTTKEAVAERGRREKLPEWTIDTIREEIVNYQQVEKEKELKQMEESKNAASKSIGMGTDRKLPASTGPMQENDSTISKNISTGVNGFFDLLYIPENNHLKVVVRMAINEFAGNGAEAETIEEIGRYWNVKPVWFVGKGADNMESQKILVILYPTVVSSNEEYHYKFGLTQGKNEIHPKVSREGQEIYARPINVDRQRKEKQLSVMHEFGHTIGLDEEYNMGPTLSTTHHAKVLGMDDPESLKTYGSLPNPNLIKVIDKGQRVDNSSKEKEEQKEFTQPSKVKMAYQGDDMESIMGLGQKIRPHHYGMVLHEFMKMMKYKEADWRIVM